jgi:hypothetical protein
VAEHAGLTEHWRKLRPLLSGIATGQRAVLPPKLVRDFSSAYEAHLGFEEALVIPLALDLLPADELATIGREMAMRRGVTITA